MLKENSADAWSQVRRCHRCGTTHVSDVERVVRCGMCKAHFAPYFFADLTPQALSVMSLASRNARADRPRPASLVLSSAKRYRPLVGISWWWNEADSHSGEAIMPRA